MFAFLMSMQAMTGVWETSERGKRFRANAKQANKVPDEEGMALVRERVQERQSGVI